MHPVVFGLLITALVLVFLGFVPDLRASRLYLWVGAACVAVLAIVLHLFVLGGAA